MEKWYLVFWRSKFSEDWGLEDMSTNSERARMTVELEKLKSSHREYFTVEIELPSKVAQAGSQAEEGR